MESIINCSGCGKELRLIVDEIYSVYKLNEFPLSNCRSCYEIDQRAIAIMNAITLKYEDAYYIAKVEKTYFIETGREVYVVAYINEQSVRIGFATSIAIALSTTTTKEYYPKPGEEKKIEFEKPKYLYDKPASKYFTKPKNNFKKR